RPRSASRLPKGRQCSGGASTAHSSAASAEGLSRFPRLLLDRGEADLLAALAAEEVDPVDEPHPVTARAHDERPRAAAVGVELDAAEQVSRRHARRDDDHLARSEIVDREDAVYVLDAVCAHVLDLAPRRGPELGLDPPAETAERRGGQDRLPRAADPDREVVVRAADGRGDRRGDVAILDQLD